MRAPYDFSELEPVDEAYLEGVADQHGWLSASARRKLRRKGRAVATIKMVTTHPQASRPVESRHHLLLLSTRKRH